MNESKPQSLTAEELRLPDVTLVIPEDRDWEIPKRITEVLRLYVGRYDKKGNVVYKIPGYLYQEWTSLLPTQKQEPAP
jgi:hypothetical protein